MHTRAYSRALSALITYFFNPFPLLSPTEAALRDSKGGSISRGAAAFHLLLSMPAPSDVSLPRYHSGKCPAGSNPRQAACYRWISHFTLLLVLHLKLFTSHTHFPSNLLLSGH